MRRSAIALVSAWLITSGCGPGSTEPRASDAGPSRADAGPGPNADAGADHCPKPPSSGAAGTRRLDMNDQPPAPDGIFDLSVDYPAGVRTGFVAYLSVEGKLVHTRVAESDDRGASFDYRSNVNTPTPTTIETSDLSVCSASQCSGHWVHETPSLAIDASDPDSQRLFKVFVHTYFVDEADVDGYRGCLGFEVKDLEAGSLTRCDGRPVVRSSILGNPSSFWAPAAMPKEPARSA